MWKFVLCSFLFLGWGFYELSGGSDFQAPVQKERSVKKLAVYDVPENSTQATLVAAAPSVTRSIAQPSTFVIPEATPAALSPVDAVAAVIKRPLARDLSVVDDAATPETTDVVYNPTVTTAPEVTITPALDLRTVSGNRVNMRNGPSTDYAVLAKLVKGDEVEVLEISDNGWVRLKVASSGQIGWMAERLLTR